MQICDTLVKYPIPCHSIEVSKCLKFLSVTTSPWAYADELFATEGVVHGVYKDVTQLSFVVTQRHKVSGGIRYFATVVTTL